MTNFSTRKTSTPIDSIERIDRLLLRTVDIGLAGCIFVVPFLWGGRQASGHFVLVALATLVGIAWFARQTILPEGRWRRSVGNLLFVAGLILLILQLIPFPAPWLAKLSPHTSELLPLWSSDGSSRLGVWSQISLAPAATQGALALYLAYGLLFVVTVQRIETIEDVERLLRWIALSVVLMALFAVVQLLVNNGKFFWFYEHPFSDTKDVAKGSFTNRNHFAHFLALGLGPLIWWVQQALHREADTSSRFGRKIKPWKRLEMGSTARLVALGIVLFALLLSLSRGGALVALLAVSISAAVCFRAGRLGPRFVGGLAGMALLIGIALAIFGYENVSQRLDSLTSASVDSIDRNEGRRRIWKTTIQAIPDFLVLGSGSGSQSKVFPLYLKWRQGRLYYSHCENGYLPVTMEMGIPGAVLIVLGLLLGVGWCWRGLRRPKSNEIAVCMGAVAAGLAVSVTHSLIDFIWYVPACMTLVTLFGACACRLAQQSMADAHNADPRLPLAKPVALAGTVALIVLGGWMVLGRYGPMMAEPHWHRYLTMIRNSSTNITLPTPTLESDERNESNELAKQNELTQSEAIYIAALLAEQQMVGELEQAVRWDPKHADAQLRLASAYLRLFRLKQQKSVNVMPLNQIRDAAMSQFASRSELDAWLTVAVGDHYRLLDQARTAAKNAVALSPLEGKGYLHLAELCFLEGATVSEKKAYVDQALTVRPNDGDVLIQAAAEAALAGDDQNWLLYSQRAFESGKASKRQLIELYVGRVIPDRPEAEIHFFLEAFQPKLYGLRLMFQRYRMIAQPEQCMALYQAYAECLEDELETVRGIEASGLWMELATVSIVAGNLKASVLANQNAVKCDPTNYSIRHRLATRLTEMGALHEARQQLEWCLRRRLNRNVETELRNLNNRIEQERRMTKTPGPVRYR